MDKTDCRTDGDQSIQNIKDLSSAVISSAQAHTKHLKLHRPGLWGRALSRGSISAYTALIFSFTPNIKTLLLASIFIQQPIFLGTLLTSSQLSSHVQYSPYMSRLRRLYLDFQFSLGMHYVLERIFPVWDFFNFPQLTDFYTDLPSPTLVSQYMAPKPRMQQLTQLYLPFSTCPPSILSQLLNPPCPPPPPLKSLMYHYKTPNSRSELTIDVVSLSRAIASLSSTLEQLTLSVEFDNDIVNLSPEIYPNGLFNGYLDRLDECTQLTEVDLPLMMLADFQGQSGGPAKIRAKLPPNMKVLRLREAGFSCWDNEFVVKDLLREVRIWVEEKGTGQGHSAWEVLEVERHLTHAMWDERDVAEITKVCASAGIRTYVGEFEQQHRDVCLQRWSEGSES
ncbi:MAG: hypothetical protein Q9216_006135 [Gyalolechia sp. 2 TL-2023]